MAQVNTEPFKERIKPFLKPNQVEDLKEEHQQLERSLSAPAHVSVMLQDKPAMFRQLSNIRKTLERDMPRKYEGVNLDLAKTREKELISSICNGMPTMEEMRRNPPGAVDKHRSWEKRNKSNILEWKNIRKRLHASGAIDDCPYDSVDVSNIEKYRPSGGTNQLNMDNSQISAKEFFMNNEPNTVVFSDDELKTLRNSDPELASMIGTLPADVRSEVKKIIKGLVEDGKKTASNK